MRRAAVSFVGVVWLLQAGTPAGAQEQLCDSPRQTVDACSGGTIEQHNYPNNAGCERTLHSSAPGSSIRLDFTSFSVESHFDWLEVFDGDSSASPQIGRFTGTDIPAEVTSSGSDLTLQLTSDSSVSSSGFVASMSCVVPSAPSAQSTTQGMCDATCGFCDTTAQSQQGLYATVTIFPEDAVAGSSEAGKAVWPNSELAIGQWEFNPNARQTKTCLRGDWFCFFPGASNFQDHASFRWVASGTGRFTVVVRPNCNVPAAAYSQSQRAQHKLVCETRWSLSVQTPMMVTTEYDLGGADSIGGNAAAIIGEAVGVDPTTVDVFSNLLAREATVHIHTVDLAEAERVHDELVRSLADSSSRLHIQLLDINGVDAGSHKVCIVPERHVVERNVVVTDQDPCVLDATTECHAQLMQMFERRVLPVSAFATGIRPLSRDPLPNGNQMLTVAVDIGLRALTQDQGLSTLQNLQQQTGSSSVTTHGQGPGHRRRHLQAPDAHNDDHTSTLWCVDRAAAVDAACCTADDDDVDCTGGVPLSCDFACALSFIPYYEACGDMLDEAGQSLIELYAKCQVAAIGDGLCERVSIVQPPVVSTREELTVEVSLTAPDTRGQTTLDLTLGLQQVTLETTADPCVLQGNGDCAAQLAMMFAVNQPGYGTHPLRLETLPQLPSSSPASQGLNVRVSVREIPYTQLHTKYDALLYGGLFTWRCNAFSCDKRHAVFAHR